jgi:galactokinase
MFPIRAAEALKQNNLEDFGGLMQHSHASLRDDYEVSCRELDLLVEIAADCKGVLGARMTGGGFGGSTVNLVRRENLGKFIERVPAQYYNQTQIKADVYVSNPADGAKEVKSSEM